MNATGVLSAQPVAASGAVRVGRRSMAGLGRSTVGAFHGNTRQLKARAVMGRRAAMPMGIRAEKVVGIDLGTTNSAVRPRSIASPSPTALSAFLRRSARRMGIVLRAQGLGGDVPRAPSHRTQPKLGTPGSHPHGVSRGEPDARSSSILPGPPACPYPLDGLLPLRRRRQKPRTKLPPRPASSATRSPPWRVAPPPSSPTQRAAATPSVVAYAKNGDRLVGQVRTGPIPSFIRKRAMAAIGKLPFFRAAGTRAFDDARWTCPTLGRAPRNRPRVPPRPSTTHRPLSPLPPLPRRSPSARAW